MHLMFRRCLSEHDRLMVAEGMDALEGVLDTDVIDRENGSAECSVHMTTKTRRVSACISGGIRFVCCG